MLFVAFLLTARLVDSGYSQIHDDKGVKVYSRGGSSAIDLGAEGDIAAPPARVREVLLDYANSAKHVKGVGESTVVAHGPMSMVVYQRLSLPVISDRDYTLLVTWGDDNGALWVRFMTANDRGPAPRSGVVRVNLHEGNWRLDPVDGGKSTHATYQFRLDLGGSMPGWMGRGRAGKDLPAMFESLRQRAR